MSKFEEQKTKEETHILKILEKKHYQNRISKKRNNRFYKRW